MSSHDGNTPNSDPSIIQPSQPSIPISNNNRGRTYLACDHCKKALELSIACKKN